MPFYAAGREGAAAASDQGIEQVVAAVLASPEFLYRPIRGGTVPTGEVPLTDLESGVAAFLLPVEHRSGRRTTERLAAAGKLSEARQAMERLQYASA